MKRLLLAVLALAILVQFAFGEPVPPSGMQVMESTTRTISGISNVSAQGGNVTELRIDALTVTKTWQGYFGNITGNIRLDDANNNSFYVWGNTTNVAGEVYAARNSTIQWSTVNCTDAAERDLEETYLGVTAVDGDSVTNTFNSTTHPSFNVGLTPIDSDSCFSTNANVNNTAQADAFHQILLSDNSSNILYTTIIEGDTHGFDGRVTDFQLMVGENEHDGNDGPTTYYFFVELS